MLPRRYWTWLSTMSFVKRRISRHKWKAFPNRDFLRSLVVNVCTSRETKFFKMSFNPFNSVALLKFLQTEKNTTSSNKQNIIYSHFKTQFYSTFCLKCVSYLHRLEIEIVVQMKIIEVLAMDEKVEHVVTLSAHLQTYLHPVQLCCLEELCSLEGSKQVPATTPINCVQQALLTAFPALPFLNSFLFTSNWNLATKQCFARTLILIFLLWSL